MAELHARAADWTTGDRRLLHRAAAADGPDAPLAAELAAAADAAHRSRRYGLAAEFRMRARAVSDDAVSDDAEERERFLLDALLDRVEGQDLAGAQSVLLAAQAAAPTARRSLALGLLDRETGDWARLAAAVLEVRVGRGAEAVRLLGGVESDDDEDATDALTTMGIDLWRMGEIGRAADLLGGFVPTPGGQAWEADLLAVRGMVHLFAGRPRRALADLDRSIDLVHLWRPSTNQSGTYVLRASARYVLGDWDGAAVDAASARALAAGGAEQWTLALALAVWVDVPAGRGQWQVARGYVEGAAAAAPPAPSVGDVITRRAVAPCAARGDHDGC